MRVFALILAACAASTLDWSSPAHCAGQTAAAEQRLPHISVVRKGSGPGVVFIPGLSSPRATWDGVTVGLAKDHTVYLVHPSQVDRLMIVDALPYFPVLLARGGPVPSPAEVDPIATMMRDKVKARYGRPMDPATTKADVDSLAMNPASRVKMAQWAAQADPRVTGQLLYEDMSTDLLPALPTLTMPITVVVPWTDTPFGQDRTMAFYHRQYDAAPKVSFAPVAQAGHFVMLDQPAKFRAELDAFLR
jgi:hypothetical protein